MRIRLLLAALCVVGACKPKPQPAPPDTSVTVIPDTTTPSPDVAATDTLLPDSILWDGEEVDTYPPGPLPPVLPGVAPRSLNTGVAQGMYDYPKSLWPENKSINAIAMNVPPDKNLPGTFKQVCESGNRIQMVIPRRYITTTGTAKAPLSLKRALQVVDLYVQNGLPAALAACPKAVIGVNLADDYGCAACWGGKIVTQQELETWAKYWKQKVPAAPLIVRVEPFWVAKYPPLAKTIDAAVCQYRTKKGPLAAYADRCRNDAAALGLRLIYGMNVTHGVEAGSPPPMTPEQVRSFGLFFAGRPEICAMVHWWMDDNFQKLTYQNAYLDVKAALTKLSWRDCRKGGA